MKKVSVGIGNKKIEDILGTVGSPSIVLSELIKNSIDSNSNSVDIYIDTNKKEITVIDKGDGLDEIDIQKLGMIGQSDKKEVGKEQRKNGEYYSGSKGLGLLSAFSLSNYIEIKTRKNDKSYLIKWEKAQGEFNYSEIKQLPDNGTKLIMRNISEDDINVLTDEEEYKKLRHVSLCHFKNISNTFEKINFYIDDKLKDEFTCCDIKDLEDKFVYKVKFNYCSQSNNLKFKFDKVNMVNSKKINKDNLLPTDRLLKTITINLNDNNRINDIIKENYKLTETNTKSEKIFKYLDSNLESFEGMFYVMEGHKGNKNDIDKFGYGIKVFTNNFAIYGYLDNDNDWLGFGPLSQIGKSTTLKPHNVFGYINFYKFNEKESSLEITNERTNFIEKAPYKKFIEIMKNIVVKIIFEVDVAYRNNHIEIKDYLKDFSNKNFEKDIDSNVVNVKHDDNDSNENKDGEYGQNKKDYNSNGKKHIIKNKVNDDNGDKGSIENQGKEDTDEIQNISSNNEYNLPLTKDNDKSLDSKIKTKKTDIKNPCELTVRFKNKPKFNFFTISNIIKINDTINIEYKELIKQLRKISKSKGLEYKDFYLILVMAFRTILEDISKRYLNIRELKLYGDFGQNIKTMTDDMLTIIKDTNCIDKNDREEIERIFGGFNAYKNFLKTTGDDFYNNGQQGIKATKLNSFVHNPRWMEIEEAESISNDIILPLIVASQEILKRMKK